MFRPLQLFRLLQIHIILMRHMLNRLVVSRKYRWLRVLTYLNPWSWRPTKHSRGKSIRLALESLGPIFVKFGQILSTRRDLFPDDIVDELEKLQDQVPPFPGEEAQQMVETAFNKPVDELFKSFDVEPLASASIAQVHTAILHDGSEVVVKILRPRIRKLIRRDLALLHTAAKLTEIFWSQGKRLRARGMVEEFETTITDEIDLLREAANASQLRRNFQDSDLLYVPKVYWEYCKTNILVMERIYGIQISDIKSLKEHGTDFKVLAEKGVEIFFTQVFRDCFFHADMHPGNLFVDVSDPKNPKYIGVDFGIMGGLTPEDQHYLAENLMGFFKRDYRLVAASHVESGWVPKDTRIDQFEATIRAVCEPIFEKPLKDISFGQLLMRLFQTAERFNMPVQPQLLLLQKTLLNVEGLGRQLYPDLDLWSTAKPLLETFIKNRKSIKNVARLFGVKFPDVAEKLIKTPELVHQFFSLLEPKHLLPSLPTPAKKSRWGQLSMIVGVLLILAVGFHYFHLTPWAWSLSSVGAVLILLGWSKT